MGWLKLPAESPDTSIAPSVIFEMAAAIYASEARNPTSGNRADRINQAACDAIDLAFAVTRQIDVRNADKPTCVICDMEIKAGDRCIRSEEGNRVHEECLLAGCGAEEEGERWVRKRLIDRFSRVRNPHQIVVAKYRHLLRLCNEIVKASDGKCCQLNAWKEMERVIEEERIENKYAAPSRG